VSAFLSRRRSYGDVLGVFTLLAVALVALIAQVIEIYQLMRIKADKLTT
jgi:hypothetical protein